jgi:hypothetical protein
VGRADVLRLGGFAFDPEEVVVERKGKKQGDHHEGV